MVAMLIRRVATGDDDVISLLVTFDVILTPLSGLIDVISLLIIDFTAPHLRGMGADNVTSLDDLRDDSGTSVFVAGSISDDPYLSLLLFSNITDCDALLPLADRGAAVDVTEFCFSLRLRIFGVADPDWHARVDFTMSFQGRDVKVAAADWGRWGRGPVTDQDPAFSVQALVTFWRENAAFLSWLALINLVRSFSMSV